MLFCFANRFSIEFVVCRTIDGVRVSKMTFVGLVTGAIGHYWYIFIDKRYLGNCMRTVLKKTIFDQMFWAPVGITLFFGILGILDRKQSSDIASEIKRKGPEVMLVDWMVYPPAQIINYRFLPTRFRVLYDCLIAFALDLYYSHIKYER